MPEINYVASIKEFGKYRRELPVRGFRYVDTARDWVSRIHSYLYEGGSDDYVESGELYRVAANGQCVLIDEYSGLDRGDGIAEGWKNACEWVSEGNNIRCDHSPVKGFSLCRYHRKDPKYMAPESGWTVGKSETIPLSEYELYRGTIKPEQVVNPSMLALLKAEHDNAQTEST